MQQVKAERFARGGVSLKVFAALVAFVLALILAPGAPAKAFANDSALSVGLAAGTHQGSGKTSFDLLTGKSATMYVQIQNASMGDTELVKDGSRVAQGTEDGNEADFEDFKVNWYKDSVEDGNLVSTTPLGWNSYYERPQWGSDMWCSSGILETAGTYKFYAVATWTLEGYQAATSDPLEFTFTVTDPVVSNITGIADPQEGGTVTFKVDNESVTQAKTGDEVTVVATPADDYTLGEVSVKDADGQDVDYSAYWESFDMPAKAVTVTATFLKVVTSDIETVASEHGKVTYKVDGEEVTQAKTGDTVRMTFEPDYGYAKESVSVVDADGNPIAVKSNSFTMPSSKVSVTATYKELPKFNVVKSANLDTTTGDLSFDKEQFVSGDTINVTITPAAGYELDEFTLTDPDGNAIQSSKWGDFTLYSQLAADGLSATIKIHDYWDLAPNGQNSDLVVGATFKVAPVRYDIETAELGEGMTSVSYKVDGKDAVKAAEGDVVTIYPVVAYGFDLDSVSVVDENGQKVETTLGTYAENGGKYYFTMTAGKVKVTVTAVAPTYSLVIDENLTNGTISFAEGVENTFTAANFNEGDVEFKLNVVPAAGFKLDEDSFSVVDESGYPAGYWDGVSWDAAQGTVTFTDWVLDGSTRTFTVKGEFVAMGADDVSQAVDDFDADNPDPEAVASARAAFDNLTSEDREKLGVAVEAKLLKAEVKVAAAEKTALEADKAELEGEIGKKNTELATVNGELTEAKTNLDNATKELAAAEKERDDAKTSLDNANKELTEAKANLDNAAKELDAAKADKAAVEKERDEAKQASANSETALVAANSKVASLEKELDTAKKAAQSAVKANPMKAKGKTVKVKQGKKATFKAKGAFTVSGAKGKVTYAKLSGSTKVIVKTNGQVIVKKGLKKGTYKVKVMVAAAGNKQFSSAVKIVTLKVQVI